MDLTKRIAMTAGALTLGLAGVAAAATTTPDAADAGLTKAAENVGFEVPASHDSHPTGDAEGEDATADDTTTDVEEESAPEDNHGAVVSAVAQSDFETGREHGEAVSAAARDNHGAEAGGDEAGEELEDESTEELEGDEDDAAGARTRK